VNATLPAEPRSEPLLWLQLLGLAALPLEALLVLLLLAGSDPGPWPWLERGLAWSLGVLGPALLLWRRPADVFSLLLLSTPLRGRRELQRRLSGLQQGWGQRLAVVLGAAALLPLLVWLDRWSVLARDWAPLPEAPRLVALLLSGAVLALMLWQWQQLLQAVWLLLRPAVAVAAAPALTAEEIASRRLCLGLPLLLPDPLRFEPVAKRKPMVHKAAEQVPKAAELKQVVAKAAELVPKAAELKTEPQPEADAATRPDAAGGAGPGERRNAGDRATRVEAAAPLSPQPAAIPDGAAPLDTQSEAAAAPTLELATTLETAERGEPEATAATPALELETTLETAASGDPQATAATLALDPEETLAPVATESLELATADEAAPSPESPTPAAPLSEPVSEAAPAAIPPAAAAGAAAASAAEAAEAAEDQQPLAASQDDAALHAADDNLPEMEDEEADASAAEPPPQEIASDLAPERCAAEPAGSPPTDAEPAPADAAHAAVPGPNAESDAASV
jgi:hypothetical protein